MLDLITMGECMVEFFCDGSVSRAEQFYKSYGGDTLNTAVAASRLGSRTGFISRVGEDPFAPYLVEEFRAEGIDLKCCPTVPGFNGLYFIALDAAGEREFTYYRTGSAASGLRAEDLDEDYIRRTKLLHASGISQAISPGCREAVRRAFEIARRAGVRTSYDPNFRSNLWTRKEAREALEEIIPLTEIFLPGGPEEVSNLLDTSDPSEIGEWARERGAQTVVIKEGRSGCLVVERDEVRRIKSGKKVKVVDTCGAGDAFNGAFLHGLLCGLDVDGSASLGVLSAGLKIEGRGAVRSLPHKRDVIRAGGDQPWAPRLGDARARDETLTAYIDGGSRGNPGPAGAGVHFELDGAPWRGLYEFLGRKTNNEAEYAALLGALEFARARGFRRLIVYSDSELLVRQIKGEYKVKNPRLKELHTVASDKIKHFKHFAIHYLPRERNRRADALANRAMDLRSGGEDPYDA